MLKKIGLGALAAVILLMTWVVFLSFHVDYFRRLTRDKVIPSQVLSIYQGRTLALSLVAALLMPWLLERLRQLLPGGWRLALAAACLAGFLPATIVCAVFCLHYPQALGVSLLWIAAASLGTLASTCVLSRWITA